MRRLLLMTFLANLWFLYPVYTLFLLSRDLNLTSILTLESVLALGMILWEVPSSVLADRWGRKKLLVLARVLDLMGMVPLFWARGFLAFAALYALSGISIASQSGALEAYLYETLADRSRMRRSLSGLRSLQFGGTLVGALVGGLAVALNPAHGYQICIGLGVASLALALLVSAWLPADRPKALREHISLGEIFKTGLSVVFRTRGVLLLAILALTTLGFSEIHYLWQPYLKQLGVATGWFGLVAIAITTCSLLGSLGAARERRRVSPLLLAQVGGMLSLVCFAAVAFTSRPGVAMPALLILFVLHGLLEPVFTAWLNEHFSDTARATSLSGVSWLQSVVHMLLRPGIGYLADRQITYPFRLDLLVVGASVIALALMGRTRTPDPEGQRRP